MIIEKYFQEGFSLREIVMFLSKHGVELSTRQLQRILKKMGLRRKGVESPLEHICTAIFLELEGSGKCLGYRSLCQKLQRSHGLRVKRSTVAKILALADPEGVTLRSRKRFRRRQYVTPGPNFLWHLDGYDKLKPFGFAIHGCIDGFSRRILWLEVSNSNNNPKVISYYYLQTVKNLGLVPRIIRADLGTENSGIGVLQAYLRFDDKDSFSGTKSFMVGKSTSNQKIEAWWSQMRRKGISWWIAYFKDMRDSGLYNGDNVETECLRFAYHKILQNELHELAKLWNQHPIRKQKNCELPSGKPDVLYLLPELFDTFDYRCNIDKGDVECCKALFTTEPEFCSPDFMVLVHLLAPNAEVPTDISQAFEMYVTLREKLNQYTTL